MKNKKGFTLLELLAVIVILAIIALIAVPIILNMIENAKKGAAKDSAYGYIEAVENYQAYEMLKGNDGLKEGIYNITENTTIGDTKYKKLTDLIKVKGKNPTFGKIGITKNGTVGTADMCVNEYPIRYENNKIEVLDGDCEDLGITLVYNISSEEWEASKTLEIMYPEGKYEYYYKLESGKAKVGEKELVIGEEIKVEANTVTMELLENSKITAWMLKNGKKISTRTYEETKIDNVEIGKASGELIAGYPLMTEYGIKISSNLTITYEEQEGTSPYYSEDGGEWKKYNGTTPVSGSKVQVKLVRDKSGRSGEVVDAVLSDSSSTDAIPNVCFDGNEGEYNGLTSDSNTFGYWTGTKYFIINENMQGKQLKITYTKHIYGDLTLTFYKENNDEISSITLNNATWTKTSQDILIPSETVKIGINMTHHAQTGIVASNCIYEIRLINEPVIKVENKLPKLTENEFEKAYQLISIDYFETSTGKFYSSDGTTWKTYDGNKLILYAGDTIYAKGRDNYTNETKIVSYTSSLADDAMPNVCFDGNEGEYNGLKSDNNTFGYWTGTKYFLINENLQGKQLKFTYTKHVYGDLTLTFYKENNDEISSITLNNATWTKTSQDILVPSETVKIGINMTHHAQSGVIASNCIYEISVVK